MVKDVFFRFLPVALAAVGWISFVAGLLLEGPALIKVFLLSAARVLPQALRQTADLEMATQGFLQNRVGLFRFISACATTH